MSALFINVFAKWSEDEDFHHLATIERYIDGDQAFEVVMEFLRVNKIVNGRYYGMPAHEHNGPGKFGVALFDAIRRHWDDYTTLTTTFFPEEIDGDGQLVNIHIVVDTMDESRTTVSYSLIEAA